MVACGACGAPTGARAGGRLGGQARDFVSDAESPRSRPVGSDAPGQAGSLRVTPPAVRCRGERWPCRGWDRPGGATRSQVQVAVGLRCSRCQGQRGRGGPCPAISSTGQACANACAGGRLGAGCAPRDHGGGRAASPGRGRCWRSVDSSSVPHLFIL